ncbi:MAG: cysteine desulfurase [Candidatus Omnitrophica bacterium]|nr:cysteine desulfurase [Candidatus Omnitrophota bacterium]
MHRIYLDHASTTPCDPLVLEAMRPFFFEQGGNPSSPHAEGREARKAVEDARAVMASFIGAEEGEITFTSGASESNNQAVFAAADALKDKGRHLVASAIEHHSVLEPLHRLEQEGFEVSLVKPRADGIVRSEDIQSALRPDTILVCLVHANNEIGTLQPVEETGRICRQRGTYFLVDATQTAGHLPVNINDIPCHYLSLSAHKFYGPKGVGALYIRRQAKGRALILGGDQEHGRRAGTQNTPGIVGMAAALKICRQQMSEEASREAGLRDEIIDFVLKEIPSSVLNGSRGRRLPNNAHFSFAGIKGEDLVSALDMARLSVSMGSACTWGRLEPSHVLTSLGLSPAMALGSLRVSVGRWTTREDIQYFLAQLKSKITGLR